MPKAATKKWSSATRPLAKCPTGIDGFDDITRGSNHAMLTNLGLVARYRYRHPHRPVTSYDVMIRALGYGWDCPHDGTANVTGPKTISRRRWLVLSDHERGNSLPAPTGR